jgi:hypothetical protein
METSPQSRDLPTEPHPKYNTIGTPINPLAIPQTLIKSINPNHQEFKTNPKVPPSPHLGRSLRHHLPKNPHVGNNCLISVPNTPELVNQQFSIKPRRSPTRNGKETRHGLKSAICNKDEIRLFSARNGFIGKPTCSLERWFLVCDNKAETNLG